MRTSFLGRSRWRRRRAVATVSSLLVTLVVVAGCGSSGHTTQSAKASGGGSASGKASGASGGTIKVGGIFTNQPFPFGVDAENMVKAVFAQVNSQGGINGRKLQFLAGDDSENTSTSGQLAREYVGDGAVAFVGSASFVDCGVNGTYYLQQHIASLTGVGVSPQCYSSPNIASVEPSPYLQITSSLYYAYQYLHDTRNCLFQPQTPGSGAAIQAAIAQYEKATGNKLTISNTSIPANTTNFLPLLLQAKDANCQSFFYGGANDTTAATILKDAAQEGMQKVHFMGASISYTQPLAGTSASLGIPFYAMTALYPFTLSSPKNAAYRSLAQSAHVNMTEFSADAYVSAEWLVSVLKAIKGPITAQSVLAYLKAGHPYATSMSPAPLVFGPGNSHPAVISKPSVVELTKSGWTLAKFGLSLPS